MAQSLSFTIREANSTLIVNDVLGRVPAKTYDALAAADERAAVRSLITFLADRTRASRPIDARITTLVRAVTDGAATVRHTAEALDLSERTVRYWSRQHVGMGMKRLWRIRRLHHALRLGLQRPDVGWGRVAADAGYADQSHLVRDCRAFLGESPTVFATRARGCGEGKACRFVQASTRGAPYIRIA